MRPILTNYQVDIPTAQFSSFSNGQNRTALPLLPHTFCLYYDLIQRATAIDSTITSSTLPTQQTLLIKCHSVALVSGHRKE
jgi:hypothetical protein